MMNNIDYIKNELNKVLKQTPIVSTTDIQTTLKRMNLRLKDFTINGYDQISPSTFIQTIPISEINTTRLTSLNIHETETEPTVLKDGNFGAFY